MAHLCLKTDYVDLDVSLDASHKIRPPWASQISRKIQEIQVQKHISASMDSNISQTYEALARDLPAQPRRGPQISGIG